MIVLLVGIERLLPRAPAPLIAVAAGIIGARLLGLQLHGVELVGHIPQGLPSITLPDFSLAQELWPGALGIALMSFTETIAAGRAFAKSEEPPIRANRELLATGIANAGGASWERCRRWRYHSDRREPACWGAHSVGRDGHSRGCAGHNPSARAALALMPQATLAAVVIVYSIGLIRPAEFRAILEIRRTEFIWALTALAGVVLLGTLKGIIVAIVLSLVALASQVADPPVYLLGRKPGTNVFRPRTKEHPEDETFPGLLLLRLEGRVFFANAEHIGQKIRLLVNEAQPKVVALDLSAVHDLEYSALKALTEGEKRQRDLGVSTWLVGLNPGVLQMVQRSPLGKALGREKMQFSLELAVAKYLELSTNVRGLGGNPPNAL